MPGFIFNIAHYAIHDGPGIRTTVFLQGCPMRCLWCHNPEGQDPVGSRQLAVGQHSIEEILREIDKDKVFYEESGGGVTFSGGEPLMQPEFLEELLIRCRAKGYHTTVDTCGFAPSEVINKMIGLADLFLYDLKLMDDARHAEYTGVSNEPVIRNLETIARAGKEVVIRFPVIPGITDGNDNIAEIAGLMKKLGLKRIDLLPYHEIAKGKYERLGMKYMLNEVTAPDKGHMEALADYFRMQLTEDRGQLTVDRGQLTVDN